MNIYKTTSDGLGHFLSSLKSVTKQRFHYHFHLICAIEGPEGPIQRILKSIKNNSSHMGLPIQCK